MNEAELTSFATGLLNAGPVIGTKVAKEFLAEPREAKTDYQIMKWCADRIRQYKEVA